ncbi:MAG TPA: glycosyltransferase family 4 protein [Chloroflexi bacterium]|nr:glycosyltransferase family 4 protein [Chloroflexota bacterium]
MDNDLPTASRQQPKATANHRVLMIAPTSFFADYGCHVRILEETRALERLGCRVTICTYFNGRDLPGIETLRTMSIPWREHYEVGSSRHKIGFDALLLLRTFGAMWRVRPTIIHAHLHEGALIGYPLARLWRVPMVFDLQGSATSEMVDHHFLRADGPLYGPMRRLERLIDRLAPRIMTSSAHVAELLVRDFGCPPHKIDCVPDFVDTEVFRPYDPAEVQRLRHAWGIPRDRTVVVYLGKLAAYQGTDHLLQAASLLCRTRSDLHFVIGGYPFVDHYEHMARDLGIASHVTFTGRVRYEDAPRLLALGDIAVSPKLSRTEGAGKLLNYMAVGLPTVAYDTEVSHEYLAEHGVYAQRADSQDLARRLAELADDAPRRVALGAALRTRAERCFSSEAAGRRILDIYAQVSGARR